MLDQSFSAKNFEIIFNLSNRKGQIKLSDMPDAYQKIVDKLKEAKKQRLEIIKKKRSNWTEDDTQSYNFLTDEINELQEKKQKCLCEYLTEIAKKINSAQFQLQLEKHEDTDTGKDVYHIKDDDSKNAYYTIKQLQYNIQRTFKVQQANRHAILTNIKILLNTKLPLYIIRSDISEFYESIPQKRLLECISDNTLLSSRSVSYINGILNAYDIATKQAFDKGKGIPRGVAISPLLSEIYMRDVDSKIMERQEVIFYARYVDDIFIVLTSLNGEETLDRYYNNLKQLFREHELTLHEIGDKCKLIDLFPEGKNTIESLTYLGYKLSINKTGRDIITTFSLSDNKKQKIKDRIDSIFSHFEKQSKYNVKQARKFLFDALKYIAGNNRLKGAKAGIKIGVYYNNDLLDSIEELDALTTYLHDKDINPSQDKFKTKEERDNYIKHIKKAIHKINLKDNWLNKKMYSLTSDTIIEIQNIL